MKINKKALDLVEVGLKPDTVAKMSESQINTLHSKMISEITMVSKADTNTINKLKTEKKPFEVYEKEMKEQPDTEVSMTDKTAGGTTQDPVQVQGPDGTDDEGNDQINKEKEISERETNPWAICTAQLGKEFGTTERHMWGAKEKNKYERCVKDVKKSLKEGEDPLNLYFEKQIMTIVEKHIPPRMTKGDLLKYLTEDGPAVAPSKPKENPTTKPGTKPGTKPQKPGHPLKNPNPGEKPAPKAGHEKAKKEVIDLIINLLDK
jgi:hypothetical protein